MKRKAALNSSYPQVAAPWLNQVQFSNQTLVLSGSFVLQNRQLLKPAKPLSAILKSLNLQFLCSLNIIKAYL
jgi:hypothetical protein